MGRVVVTGGAGFIGSHLVERLVAAETDVVVLDDFSRGRLEWLPPSTEFHEVDVRDRARLRQVVREIAPETVVHLAAMHYIPAVEDAPKLAEEVNVDGTRILLEALADRPPKIFVFASTGAVYPDQQGPIPESSAPAPIDLYGRTKLQGERMVEEFAEKTGAKPLVVRIFNVIGPRETNAHVVPEVIGQLRRGEVTLRLGNLSPKRDYTDVRDVATALERLLAVDSDHHVFNLGSGRSTSVADLVELCESILDRSLEVEVEEGRRRAQDRAELVADPTLLRGETGWQPTFSMRDTVAALLAGA